MTLGGGGGPGPPPPPAAPPPPPPPPPPTPPPPPPTHTHTHAHTHTRTHARTHARTHTQHIRPSQCTQRRTHELRAPDGKHLNSNQPQAFRASLVRGYPASSTSAAAQYSRAHSPSVRSCRCGDRGCDLCCAGSAGCYASSLCKAATYSISPHIACASSTAPLRFPPLRSHLPTSAGTHPAATPCAHMHVRMHARA